MCRFDREATRGSFPQPSNCAFHSLDCASTVDEDVWNDKLVVLGVHGPDISGGEDLRTLEPLSLRVSHHHFRKQVLMFTLYSRDHE